MFPSILVRTKNHDYSWSSQTFYRSLVVVHSIPIGNTILGVYNLISPALIAEKIYDYPGRERPLSVRITHYGEEFFRSLRKCLR